MKKLAFAALAAAVLCGCSDSGADKVKMITEATFPPYEFLRGHEIVGIDVEICRAIAQKLGREFSCETVDFDSVIPAVISGKADLAAAGITITEDRKKNVDFSVPYVKTGIVVIYKKSVGFTGAEQLKGKKIGVQGGTTSETYVLNELKQEPERSRSPAESVAALKSGRVEFVIADIDPAKNCVKGEPDLAISDFITSEEYAIAIKKGQPELLKAINETIAEIKADGRLAKWIADYTAEADKLKDK
ncbi:MAG: amino acid ABC transporter substrate-binding protein [Kiritimatiellae bacterium]|nr:amino acid ABC transporter substrate-binding protein [Kiritimatiellia bacterium]